MIAVVRAVLDAIAHAAKRVVHDLREGAGIRAVGPELCANACQRREHHELESGPVQKWAWKTLAFVTHRNTNGSNDEANLRVLWIAPWPGGRLRSACRTHRANDRASRLRHRVRRRERRL